MIDRLFQELQQTPYSLTREQVANTLAEIGGTEINERLVGSLRNKQVDDIVRYSIAGALGSLGEKSVVGDLLALLKNKQVNWNVGYFIAGALETLVDDFATVQELAALLQTQNIADDIYRALWEISRRMRITVYITDGQVGPEVKIVPWE